jgi:hypothetical protein
MGGLPSVLTPEESEPFCAEIPKLNKRQKRRFFRH